ncbi:hypothetical protein F2Q68_00020494 [Brassica cretica]|uniref:Uncharacterized protein n=1 Tax=Brassica cretica TaxID=69181 RepID=A0A8S9FWR8_BRACR|nr:hypothetical protein F2Q68_00020494 [Brassica cretica]
MVHGPPPLSIVEWDGFGRIQWGRFNSWGQELKEAGGNFTLRTGSVTMGNGEHDTTLDLSEVWDGLQGSNCNDGTTTSLAQLLN